MKRTLVRWTGLIVITALVGVAAVALARNASVKQLFVDRELDAVLEDYTDKVVLKTISLAVQEIEALERAALKLQAEPSDANLAAAADAWRSARAKWKQASAIMFGPAAHYNFDKQLATFPLDRPLVDHVLGVIEAGRLKVDERYLREELHSSQRGFLALEYLLFREGKPRQAKELSAAQLAYLVAAAKAMTVESADFQASWLGSANMPGDRAALLKAAGTKTRSSYADEFKNPGSPDSRYHSQSVPLQEIAQDLVGVTEDLCPAIAEVLGSSDPRASETWYSRNGAADLENTLKGLENAYLGGVEGARGHSFSELLAARDQVLDQRIRIALADTAYRIAEAGDPYSGNGEGRELLVRRAEAACRKLAARVSAGAPLVSLDPGTRPHAAYGK